MKDAIDVSMDFITRGVKDYNGIAREAFPFVKRAAKVRDKRYTPSEKEAVIEKFLIAVRFYSQVTGMQGITTLDLT
jgi:transposase-like protein